MKTREEYNKETTELLRTVTIYHAIRPEQALRLFPKKEDTIKTIIRKLVKQKRLYFDEEKNLLCDCLESAAFPDYGMIAALWVLLDFRKSIIYHNSSDFPTKITFFAQDEVYEIIYVSQEQEALINHALSSMSKETANRLVILETEEQAAKLTISNTLAFCIVMDGTVSYYRKGEATDEQN